MENNKPRSIEDVTKEWVSKREVLMGRLQSIIQKSAHLAEESDKLIQIINKGNVGC